MIDRVLSPGRAGLLSVETDRFCAPITDTVVGFLSNIC